MAKLKNAKKRKEDKKSFYLDIHRQLNFYGKNKLKAQTESASLTEPIRPITFSLALNYKSLYLFLLFIKHFALELQNRKTRF